MRAIFLAIPMLAVLSLPTVATAQDSDDEIAAQCNNFAWLLGTWESWDHRGGEFGRSRTGGRLVFTMDADGAVSAEILALNDFMEEHGYREGMTVFRGFNESVSFTPGGSSANDARNGQFFHLDVTNTYDPQVQGGYWRDSLVGLRHPDHAEDPNGLYLQPTEVSILGGHAKWRRVSSATQTRSRDACSPATEPEPVQPQPQDRGEDSLLEALPREYLERILDPDEPLPPVILNPDRCGLADAQTARVDAPATETPRMNLEQVEEHLSMLKFELDTATDAAVFTRLEYQELVGSLEQELEALILARALEAQAGRRAALAERAGRIQDILAAHWQAESSTPEDSGPSVPRSGPGQGCPYIPPPVLVDMNSEDDELEVLDVRQTATSGFGQAYQDRDTRLANLRDRKETLEAMLAGVDFNNPDADELASYATLMGGYQRLLRLHEQEAEALRLLLERDDISDDQRRNYQAELGQYLGELADLGELDDAFFDSGSEARESVWYRDADGQPLFGLSAPDDPYGNRARLEASLNWPNDRYGDLQPNEGTLNSRAMDALDARLSEAFPEGYVLEEKEDYFVPRPATGSE